MLTLDSVAMPSIDSLRGQWAVVRIYCETGAANRFVPYLIRECQEQSIGCHIPLGRIGRHRNDRGRSYTTHELKPVFSGAVFFVNADDPNATREAISIFRKRIPTATGKLEIVKDQKLIDRELRDLDGKLQDDPDFCFTAPIREGQMVRICRGPTMGIVGKVIGQSHGKCDFQLAVTFLGRAAVMEVPADFIEQV